jgi:hypothetical protein
MAVMMQMRWDGVTPEQYEQARETVGWERDVAKGGILHIAWFTGDGIRVCDVWDTADDFTAFVEQRLMPGVAQVGIAGTPDVEIRPLYNHQLERSAPAGAVVEQEDIPVEAYRALETKVRWREEPPVGGICHIAAIDGPSVHTVSVWDSAASCRAFGEQRVGPAAAELGFPDPDAEGQAADLLPLHRLFDATGTVAVRR